jgi:hypothetical protein
MGNEAIQRRHTYKLTGEHQQLFEDVLEFTRETVQDPKPSPTATANG